TASAWVRPAADSWRISWRTARAPPASTPTISMRCSPKRGPAIRGNSMSLVPLTLDLLKRKLKEVDASACPSRRILSLGYPDILASPAQIEFIFGKEIASKLEL